MVIRMSKTKEEVAELIEELDSFEKDELLALAKENSHDDDLIIKIIDTLEGVHIDVDDEVTEILNTYASAKVLYGFIDDMVANGYEMHVIYPYVIGSAFFKSGSPTIH